MLDHIDKSNEIPLGQCLHDGVLEGFSSDLMARTLTISVDSPFHWEFHKLAETTRFEVLGEGVRAVTVFGFQSWPGSIEPSRDVPWKQAQEQRNNNLAKGRLVSLNWADFAAGIGTKEEHIILSADLVEQPTDSQLKLGILCPDGDYRDIEVRAEKFRLLIGGIEQTVAEFQKFGDAYWEDWSLRAKSNA